MAFCRPPAGPERQGLRVADVLRAALLGNSRPLPASHWKVLNALVRCRTQALGGHLYHCEDCGRDHFVPHSCRNRHCPGCQRASAIRWLQKQCANVLAVPYFHIVFTLPHCLNPLIAQNQRALYNLLFAAASATLLKFGRERLKAQIGVTVVLHTWSQTLMDHYHLHCVVTGGGLAPEGWKSASATYLFPVRALSVVFAAKFRDGLKTLHEQGALEFHGQLEPLGESGKFRALLTEALAKPWNVYIKRPFAGPEAVLAYLSRYTHRVAIGNGRILDLDERTRRVRFAYKDYADHSRRKTMPLDLDEFLRRFCLHILPGRFVKIRHYGLLGNHKRSARIERARELIEGQSGAPSTSGLEESGADAPEFQPRCPHCGSLNLTLVEIREPVRGMLALCDSS